MAPGMACRSHVDLPVPRGPKRKKPIAQNLPCRSARSGHEPKLLARTVFLLSSARRYGFSAALTRAGVIGNCSSLTPTAS